VRGEKPMRSQESLRREEEIVVRHAPRAADATLQALAAPDLARLPRARLLAMRAAGCEIRECFRVLQKGGLNLVGEVLRGQGTFYEMAHYPENDVFDEASHAQYYYHAHRAGEHGHFHAFLRRGGMPQGMTPLDLPHDEAWPEGDAQLAHLIAISMDGYGFPIGLFTPNRWVVDDAWFSATDLIRMLDAFRVDHAYPSWPVNRWIGAMMVLFRPHIERLLRARDRAFADWRTLLPGEDVLERRQIEIFSSMPIAVDDTIAAVHRALEGKYRQETHQ